MFRNGVLPARDPTLLLFAQLSLKYILSFSLSVLPMQSNGSHPSGV